MNDSTGQSADDRRAQLLPLARAPFMVFLLVAGIDGKIDRKEVRRFVELLQHPDYKIFAAIILELGMEPDQLLLDVQQNVGNPIEDLIRLTDVLDRNFPESALGYKQALLMLGKAIAEASGGLFGLFGSKISKDEKSALAAIASALGLFNQDEKPRAKLTEAAADGVLRDDVYPALKPADWAANAKGRVALRSVFNTDEIVADEPVVAYAIDLPESIQFINRDRLAGETTLDQLHERALINLERRLAGLDWHEFRHDTGTPELGVVKGLVLTGDHFAAEALLVPGILEKAHEKLGAAMLMAIAPVRGQLYVGLLPNEENPEPDRLAFASFAMLQYFKQGQAPIAPRAWIVVGGRVRGHVAGMQDIIAVAEQRAEKDRQAEDRKLEHSAKGTQAGAGFGIDIAVVAHDVEVLLKNLEHVIRGYVNNAIKHEGFSGRVEVSVKIADPRATPDTKAVLVEGMDDMFDFLGKQFANIGLSGSAGEPVTLHYSFVDE